MHLTSGLLPAPVTKSTKIAIFIIATCPVTDLPLSPTLDVSLFPLFALSPSPIRNNDTL